MKPLSERLPPAVSAEEHCARHHGPGRPQRFSEYGECFIEIGDAW